MEQFCTKHPGTVGCGGAGSESAAGSSGLSAEASEGGSSGASSGGSSGGSGGKSGGGSGILGEIHRMITDHIGTGASGAGAHSGSESESEGSAGSEGSGGEAKAARLQEASGLLDGLEDEVAKKKLAAIAAIVKEARSKVAKEEAQKVKDKMAKLEEMADQLIAQGGKGSGSEGGSGSSCCGDHSPTTEVTSEASEEQHPVVAEGGEAPQE